MDPSAAPSTADTTMYVVEINPFTRAQFVQFFYEKLGANVASDIFDAVVRRPIARFAHKAEVDFYVDNCPTNGLLSVVELSPRRTATTTAGGAT